MGKKQTGAQSAYSSLVGLGLTPEQATGVVGNLVIESGVSPTAIGDHGTSHGIAQWHNDRWTKFLGYVKESGFGPFQQDPYSLPVQLNYLVHEAQATGVWDQVKRAKSVQDAATIWMRQCERPADQSPAAATRRAQAGVKAVEGAANLDPIELSLLKDAAALPGEAADAAKDAVTGDVLSRVQPLAYKVTFVLLGVGLIGAGLYAGVMSKSPAGAALRAL
jgi:hypothetical protein